jgi:hypothetical protein
MNEISITIEQEISPEDINDLVVTALEGGINHWCRKAKKKRNADGSWFGVAPENQDKIEFASDLIGYNGVLTICDAESSDKWELTLENVLKGIQMRCTNKKILVAELMDDYDADDADAIVQYALFNELVFG